MALLRTQDIISHVSLLLTYPMLLLLLIAVLFERVMISPPAVSTVSSGGCQSDLSSRELVLAVCGGQGVAEQLRGVQGLAGGVRGADPGEGAVGQLGVRLCVVPEVVMRVCMAWQGPVR